MSFKVLSFIIKMSAKFIFSVKNKDKFTFSSEEKCTTAAVGQLARLLDLICRRRRRRWRRRRRLRKAAVSAKP